MLTSCSGTALVPLTPPFHQSDLQISRYRKKFWTEKQKFLNNVQDNALELLTPPFNLYDLRKSRYRKKLLWTEKQN